jgi:hypothetical protein
MTKNFLEELDDLVINNIFSYLFYKYNNDCLLYSNNSILNTCKYFYSLKDKYFYFIFNEKYSLKYLNDLEFREKIKTIITTKKKLYVQLTIDNYQKIKLDDVDSVSLYITNRDVIVDLSNINNVVVFNSNFTYFNLYNINYVSFYECKFINFFSEFDKIIKLKLYDSSLLNINQSCNLKTLETLDLDYSYISKTIDENILRNLHNIRNLNINNTYIIDIYNFGYLDFTYVENKIDVSKFIKKSS